MRLLTTLQLHYARLNIHGEILQIHRTRQRQCQSKHLMGKSIDFINHTHTFWF